MSVNHVKKQGEDSSRVSAQMSKTIFYNSMASNELVAHAVSLKYQHAMPLYRQEAYFDMLGASFSRHTLCNWTLLASSAL